MALRDSDKMRDTAQNTMDTRDTRTDTRKKPTLFRRHRALHGWLLGALGLWGLYVALRGNRGLMNRWVFGLDVPVQTAFGRLWAGVPFSVMEGTLALGAGAAVWYLIWSVRGIIRAKGRRRDRAYGAALGLVCAAVSFQALCSWLWGTCFWADSFQDRSGLCAAPVSVEELGAVAAYFAGKLIETADTVPRDDGGVFAVSREEILSRAPAAYDGLEQLYPFLSFADTGVKPMALSRLMSAMDFTGFYCSWTGEANVNVDSPACLLPSTAAHEMAHQRGVASEQECNFLAVLACVTGDLPEYRYSGWLMGYIYLSNALYRADPAAWETIRETLPEAVRADLAANSAYWAQFRDTPVRTASNQLYDAILRGYGEDRGLASYGACVDLLAAYWRTGGFTALDSGGESG